MPHFRVATVLPPRERFAPGEAGAIALLAHRLVEKDEVVIGTAPETPVFQNCIFQKVTPSRFWPLSTTERYASGVAALLKRLKPEMVEIHNRPEVALALRRHLPRLPFRLVLHNDPSDMRRARTARERQELTEKMAVATVSNWLRMRFLEGLPANTQVEVLPNCLDLSVLPPSAPPEKRDPLILFAGRIVSDKGADLFVQACANVLPQRPDWRAVMIGADRFGPNSPETPFLSTLRPRATAAGVEMAGFLPHSGVLKAMRQAAIVVAPSRWNEPFGLVALEAMACGAAIVTSLRGGLPEVVGNDGYLIDPDRPEELTQALLRLTADSDLRCDLAKQGQQRAALFDLPEARLKRRHARAY